MGVTGIMIGVGVGLLRVVPVRYLYLADLQPVDYAVNLIIAAAWNIASVKRNGERKGSHIKIFNCVSGVDAPITWGELVFFFLRDVNLIY